MQTQQETPMAVNDRRLTQADFVEWLIATMRTGFAKVCLIVVGVALCLIVCLIVLALAMGWKVDFVSLWPAGVCLLVAGAFAYAMPRWVGRLRYRQYLMMAEHGPKRCTAFYTQYLEIQTNGMAQGRYWYADIQKVFHTKHLYVLKFANQVYCAVRKDGFAGDSWQQVYRCIQAERATRPSKK